MLKEKMLWIFYEDMMKDEYRQCMDEGRCVEPYAPEIDRILAIQDEEERNRQAKELLIRMEEAPIKEDFRYQEPTALEDIRNCLSSEAEKIYAYDTEEFRNRIIGAIYGRVIACVLGMPVEGWMRGKIHAYLKDTDQMPLQYYISSSGKEEIRQKYDLREMDPMTSYDRQKVCWFQNLKGTFPNDDDINYTMIALKLVERYGRNFTREDVAEAWLLGFPAFHACTAERAAIRNLMNGVLPPKSAVLCNPYREWIGAQIRGDFFGYINPGNPGEAARMAYLDASVSHVKNGVYGEMYIAALISMCFVPELSMKERIRVALLQIPPRSRLKESLDEVCRWKEDGWTYEAMVDEVHKRYREEEMYDWCLTIPNAMLVTACLLCCEEFDAAITAAVLAGFDTDCNGATVGSVMGALHGFEAIDPKWYEAFDGIAHTSVHGYHEMSLKEMAERTIMQVEHMTRI